MLEPVIIPFLRGEGIGLVPFSPLGRGSLTGTAKPAKTIPKAISGGEIRVSNARILKRT